MSTSVNASNWEEVRRAVNRAFRTSLHCAVATVDPEGAPHVTPIGSVLLGEPGKAIFFEIFTANLRKNTAHEPRVSILAVDSGRSTWVRALLRGNFVTFPAVRLHGRVVAPARPSIEAERARWQKRVRAARFTRGYQVLWKKLDHVRDVAIDEIEWVRLGAMTAHCR